MLNSLANFRSDRRDWNCLCFSKGGERMWIWNKSVILFLHFFPSFFLQCFSSRPCFSPFSESPSVSCSQFRQKRQLYPSVYLLTISLWTSHTHSHRWKHCQNNTHSRAKSKNGGWGQDRAERVHSFLYHPNFHWERGWALYGKRSQSPRKGRTEAQRAPEGPCPLSGWPVAEACGWGLQTGPPFPGLERLLSRGWPLLLLPCWQLRQEATLGFATRPSWVPDPVHVRLFPKLFYIFLLILSTAVQLPTPFTLTSCPQPNALP